MPNNWKTYKLGEIADIQNGYAFKAAELVDKGVPVIKIKNIISPNVSIEDVSYYNGELTDNIKKYIIEKGDFLISMTGSTVNVMSSAVGKMGRYRLDDKSLINQRVGKIYLTKPDIASFEYVCQYLNRYEIHYNLALNATGSANQANISPAQIKDIEILLPPLEEQKSIAAILSAIDDKIENNLAINKTLEEMAMALYKHWFLDFGPFQDGEFVESELGMIPKGWEVKRLSEIYVNHNKKRKPISTNERAKIQGEFPYYGATKILDYINYFNFEGEYILLAEDGTVKTERDTPFLQFVSGKFCVSNHAHVITGNNDYSNEFLYLSLSNINVIPIITGAVQLKINKENLEKLQFIVPPKELLKDIENKIIPLYKKIKENELEIQTLTQLRDTLLPKLISGELRMKEFRE
jgi:type I restriction enzyme S subunit